MPSTRHEPNPTEADRSQSDLEEFVAEVSEVPTENVKKREGINLAYLVSSVLKGPIVGFTSIVSIYGFSALFKDSVIKEIPLSIFMAATAADLVWCLLNLVEYRQEKTLDRMPLRLDLPNNRIPQLINPFDANISGHGGGNIFRALAEASFRHEPPSLERRADHEPSFYRQQRRGAPAEAPIANDLAPLRFNN